MKSQNEMVELAGLWASTDKNGNMFFSGSLNGARILIFENKFRESEKHPSHKIYITKRDKSAYSDDKDGTDRNSGDLPF